MKDPKHYRLLWTGQSLSNLADSLYILTVVTIVYTLTGSALFSSLIPLARVAGQLTCGLLAPLIMDRFKLTSLIKLSQLLQVILFGVLVLITRSMNTSGIPLALLMVALLSFTDGITTPVRNSLIPQYAGKDTLLKANGLMATTDQMVLMLGWAGGGVLVSRIGGPAAMLWILALYGLSLALTLLLREPMAQAEAAVDSVAAREAETVAEGQATAEKQKTASAWSSIKEGWQTMWRNSTLRLILTMEIVEGAVGASWIGALLLVYVTEQIKQDTEWYGFLNGGYFAGAILGGVILVSLTKRLMRNPALSIITGAGVMGVMTLIFAYTTSPWLALFLTVAMGPFQQVREVTQRTVFQQACPEPKLPKVMSAENTLNYTLFGLSVVLLSWMTDRFGITFVYTLTGLFSLVVCLIAIINRNKLQTRDSAS
ncbi:MFS transporter [Gorillibacterium timonense]|uniref:MFS transporter n=1 Tax=Gorillibacterium timonense TaxID=1689269 RepID=UPI00071D8528|nr:MFS transporter [Gorillibacterium timonense]